jgi:phosphoribosylformylglycinamidine cyclo-ligase
LNVSLPPKLKEIVMLRLALRWRELRALYEKHGFNISFLGGETADLPDQVRSAVFDMTIAAYAKRGCVIKGNIEPGDKIYGFASDGQARWEDKPNSGIMANGLTLGRSCMLWKGYNRCNPNLKRAEPFYTGRFLCDGIAIGMNGMTVGEALLSPTRQWPLVIRMIMEKLISFDALHLLHGISINTGGGATKIKNLGHDILYVKNMPEPALFFRLIQSESEEEWRNMFKTFNCGIGIDIIGKNDPSLDLVIQDVARECDIKAYELGACLNNPNKDKENKKNNVVLLKTPYGAFRY